MRLPTIRGVIDRRILVNFRVTPKVLENFLPSPFRPQAAPRFQKPAYPARLRRKNQSLLGKLRRFRGGNIPLFRHTANIPRKG